ncbi:hypothetical protein PG985_000351 [Apiospora marii]|uniref:uncharacterized protein n=1 Tax=Apiospora marii TaxID=335849 RepID=UPI003131FF58
MRITPAMLVLSYWRPDPVDQSVAKGLTVDLFNDGGCSGGKFEGWYEEKQCYSTQGNRGMHIINKKHYSCHLTVYKGDGCSSGDNANLDQSKCWEIGNRGSFKIFC